MENNKKQESILGYIERITFQNPENGFTIAHLKQSGRKELTCITGSMPDLIPGQTVRCEGKWNHHLIYGRQFNVEKYHQEAPADVVGIKKYLGSGLIPGIGEHYASRIVNQFGVDTLNILDQNPDKLLEVSGLGKKRVNTIKENWDKQRSVRDVMIFLQQYEVSPSYAQKIYKIYGNQSIEKVKHNPYGLARDIKGIGFKTADTIAARLGIAKDAPHRIEAGIEFVLSELASEGHVCFPVKGFIVEAEKILEVDKSAIESRIMGLKQEQRVEVLELFFGSSQDWYIWIRSLYMAETGIAREIMRLKKSSCSLRAIDLERALTWVQDHLKITLADNQKKAVGQALCDKIHIITGGPGTGKSTITNAILAITSKITTDILLAAPTGRAAKRMTEITGRTASTIHSLLELDFKTGKFKRNKDNPLECDLIIVDEASMIDTYLMFSLLKAIPSHARVIIVGDINQLPSVGPGNVLKDLIQSHCVPVTILTEIFRQAKGSKIVTNAHRINQGVLPEIYNGNDSDFFFIQAGTPELILKEIISLVSQRLPKKYGYNAFEDIQVLAPMKKGEIGIENLNFVLQKTLNPNQESFHFSGRQFSVGDKVMQIRNDYERNIYNGDIGRITKILPSEQSLTVLMDDQEVTYKSSQLEELVLSYAVSIHKYQGSECPCVIIPVHTSHYMLLTRNLFYTGVTRGKKLVVLVGTQRALTIAVGNDEVKKRHTGLQQALLSYRTKNTPI